MNRARTAVARILGDLGVLGGADAEAEEHLTAVMELHGRTAMTLLVETVDHLEAAADSDAFVDGMGEWGALLRRTRGADERNPRAGEVFLGAAREALDDASFDTLVVTTFLVVKLAADRGTDFEIALAETVESIADITTSDLPLADDDHPISLREFLDGLRAEELIAHVFDATRQTAEVVFGHPVLR